MHAWRRDRARHVHTAIEYIADDLQDRGDDAAAARRAGNKIRLAVLEYDGRRHRRQRTLARRRLVGRETDQTVGVRRIGLDGKIVELVVEDDAGAVGDEADAVTEIERVGVRHRVAKLVDNGKMRGVVALVIDGAAG